jgi:hypothetical protein
MARSTPYMMRWAVVSASLAMAACRLDTTEPIPDEPMTLVGADRQGRIHLVDETSGATSIVDTVFIQWTFLSPDGGGISRSVPMGTITSMVWVPGGDMWWVGTARVGICQNCIYSYDPAADTARLVRRKIEEVDTLGDFAVHPNTGRVYTFKGGIGGYLFRVDVADGWFYEVMRANEGASGKGSTFTPDGELFVAAGTPDQALTRINVTRAELEQVGPLTYVDFPPLAYDVEVQSLATRADGTVYALVVDADASRSFLATLDPSNAVVVNLGTTPTPLNALAYVPSRLIP